MTDAEFDKLHGGRELVPIKQLAYAKEALLAAIAAHSEPAAWPVLTWQDRMKIDMRPWAQDAAMQGEIADLRAILAQAEDAIIKRDATALRVAQCAGDFAREAAQGADDALDAARYQFMRNHQVVKEPYNMILHVAVRQPAPNGWCVDSVRGIEMDAAIDKAIAQEKAQ